MIKKIPTINRKQLSKALLMYKNYIDIYYNNWDINEREKANKTLLLLWVFFRETVLFDNREGSGFEEDAESVNDFCYIIITELTDFSDKINQHQKNINSFNDFSFE